MQAFSLNSTVTPSILLFGAPKSTADKQPTHGSPLVGTQPEKFRSVTLSAADLASLIIQQLKTVILSKEGKREGNKGKCRASGDHGVRPASQDKEGRTV